MVIYKTTNLVNDKIYIGQDKNNNPNYLGSGKKLKRAIKKYGKNNFLKEVIEICDSEELLNEREIFWISYYKSTDRKTGYNISDGSKEGDRRLGYNSLIKKGRYKTWLEKYGKEEADRKHHEWKQKISDYCLVLGTNSDCFLSSIFGNVRVRLFVLLIHNLIKNFKAFY